jgi:hypothetical protein
VLVPERAWGFKSPFAHAEYFGQQVGVHSKMGRDNLVEVVRPIFVARNKLVLL